MCISYIRMYKPTLWRNYFFFAYSWLFLEIRHWSKAILWRVVCIGFSSFMHTVRSNCANHVIVCNCNCFQNIEFTTTHRRSNKTAKRNLMENRLYKGTIKQWYGLSFIFSVWALKNKTTYKKKLAEYNSNKHVICCTTYDIVGSKEVIYEY